MDTGEGVIIPPRVPEASELSLAQTMSEPDVATTRDSLVDRFRRANILAYTATNPIQAKWAEEEADELRTLLSRLPSK